MILIYPLANEHHLRHRMALPRQAQTMLTQLSEQSSSHDFIESKDHQPLGAAGGPQQAVNCDLIDGGSNLAQKFC